MNIQFALTMMLLGCFYLNTLAQPNHKSPIEVSKLSEQIELTPHLDIPKYEKLKILDSLLELQRYHFELLGYRAKYDLAVASQDKEEKILLLGRIRNYPFSIVHETYYFYEFRNLYIHSTIDLINEYYGDLDALLNLKIVPSTTDQLYGFLRNAIEYSGGTWDKGDIPVPPDIIKQIEKSRKH